MASVFIGMTPAGIAVDARAGRAAAIPITNAIPIAITRHIFIAVSSFQDQKPSSATVGRSMAVVRSPSGAAAVNDPDSNRIENPTCVLMIMTLKKTKCKKIPPLPRPLRDCP